MGRLLLLASLLPLICSAATEKSKKQSLNHCPPAVINVAPSEIGFPEQISVKHNNQLEVKIPDTTNIRVTDKRRDFWDNVSEIALPILNFAFVVGIFFWQFVDRKKQRQEEQRSKWMTFVLFDQGVEELDTIE